MFGDLKLLLHLSTKLILFKLPTLIQIILLMTNNINPEQLALEIRSKSFLKQRG